jgi:hypothetical protein
MQLYPGCQFSQGLRTAVGRLLRGRVDLDADALPARQASEKPAARSEARDVAAAGARPRPDASAFEPKDRLHPGSYLRRRREQLGLPIALLCERTRIRQLECIEQERFDELPPELYVRGYVLAYARALGIVDPALVTASFLECWRRATRRGIHWRRNPRRISEARAAALRG